MPVTRIGCFGGAIASVLLLLLLLLLLPGPAAWAEEADGLCIELPAADPSPLPTPATSLRTIIEDLRIPPLDIETVDDCGASSARYQVRDLAIGRGADGWTISGRFLHPGSPQGDTPIVECWDCSELDLDDAVRKVYGLFMNVTLFDWSASPLAEFFLSSCSSLGGSLRAEIELADQGPRERLLAPVYYLLRERPVLSNVGFSSSARDRYFVRFEANPLPLIRASRGHRVPVALAEKHYTELERDGFQNRHCNGVARPRLLQPYFFVDRKVVEADKPPRSEWGLLSSLASHVSKEERR